MNASRFDGNLRWLQKVRLYPTCAEESALLAILKTTRELYNAMLQQRRDAWTTRRHGVKSKQQYAEITELRRAEPRFAAVYRECEDAALHRLDLAAAYFRRIKRGETAGYPRFKNAARWHQIEFPHGDRALRFDTSQQRVDVPGVGTSAGSSSLRRTAGGTAFSRRIGPLFRCLRTANVSASIAAYASSRRPATVS